MSYEAFKAKVSALIARAGGEIEVDFSQEPEDGKFYAECSDGVTIVGNRSSIMVSVHWGADHYSMAAI